MNYLSSIHIDKLKHQCVCIPPAFLILLLFCFSFTYPGFAVNQGKSINVVADDNYPPYIFRNDKGELQGIVVDEWKLWETKTGIHANIIAMDWGKAYKYMLEGKADVIETIFVNQERANIFDFTSSYARIEVPVFFHKTLSGISDVRTLRGFTIGVKSGDLCIDILKNEGITTLKEYNNYESIIKAAENGEVRVFCIDKPPALYYLYKNNLENDFKYSFTLYSNEFHRAVKKGNTELLSLIDKGFSKIPEEEKEKINKKWLGTAISQPPIIRYAIYIVLFVVILAFLLLLINFILRRKVKEKTRELKAAKEKAEEMNRLKSSFLANMSHELRTPMVGILGYTEMLCESENQGVKEAAQMINQSGHRLMDTLNLILNLSRIEAGKLQITLKSVDIIKIANECCHELQDAANRKSLQLKIETRFPSLELNLDEALFKAVICNLTSNAIKYTFNGNVTIKIDTEISGGTQWAVLKIKDTGIGIAQKDLPLIWDEFRQVSEGIGRNFEGTGLGLSITKKFVDKMNGTISVESKLNAGSEFTVRFPFSNPPGKTGAEKIIYQPQPSYITAPAANSKQFKVLYVEDDALAIHFVSKILESSCSMDFAKNSETAIEKASTKKYDVILMDINLGRGADGIQTTRIIRQMDDYKNTPIVAITAFAMEGDREEFLKAGCSHYLSKPFGRKEIVDLMNNFR